MLRPENGAIPNFDNFFLRIVNFLLDDARATFRRSRSSRIGRSLDGTRLVLHWLPVWSKETAVKARLGILLAVAIAFPAALAGAVPGPGGNHAFLFASPNTRESLSDADAKARLNSFGQINAAAVADRAACALTRDVRIADSLGIYDTSAENSFILEADLEQKSSEYLAALLGLYSRQKFVLLFLDEPGGHDRLWIIETPQPLQAVISALRKRKLTPATVRTEKDQAEIWFVDLEEKRAADLKNLTSDVHGRAISAAGAAEMLGNQGRAKAVNGWRQQISAFEQQSGRRLSEQLSSKRWRLATEVHSCSSEMSLPKVHPATF